LRIGHEEKAAEARHLRELGQIAQGAAARSALRRGIGHTRSITRLLRARQFPRAPYFVGAAAAALVGPDEPPPDDDSPDDGFDEFAFPDSPSVDGESFFGEL
jgi:hypothetical protein